VNKNPGVGLIGQIIATSWSEKFKGILAVDDFDVMTFVG
jgi:hypothetical protein